MDDIYKSIEEYNPNKKWEILIVFDDMITHKLRKKKLNSIVTESLIGDGKLNILYFTSTKHLYFAVPKKYYTKFYTLLLWKFQTNESFNNCI